MRGKSALPDDGFIVGRCEKVVFDEIRENTVDPSDVMNSRVIVIRAVKTAEQCTEKTSTGADGKKG